MAKPKPGTKERQPVAGQSRKSDAISLRVDPITRFGLELAARITKRSVSGVVESAIDSFFDETKIQYPLWKPPHTMHEATLRTVLANTWSPNEVERLVMIGLLYPQLLDFDESRMFKVISDSREMWTHATVRSPDTFRWKRAVELWEQLRPMVVENSQKAVVKPLTTEQLEALGIPIDEEHPAIELPPTSPRR